MDRGLALVATGEALEADRVVDPHEGVEELHAPISRNGVRLVLGPPATSDGKSDICVTSRGQTEVMRRAETLGTQHPAAPRYRADPSIDPRRLRGRLPALGLNQISAIHGARENPVSPLELLPEAQDRAEPIQRQNS